MENEGFYGSFFISKGGIGTHIRNGRVCPSMDNGFRGIDPIGGAHVVFRELKVRRGKSQDIRAPMKPMDNVTGCGIEPSQQVGRFCHIPLLDEAANGGAGYNLPIFREEGHHFRPDRCMLKEFQKHGAVSESPMTEGKIFSGHYACKSWQGCQLFQKRFCRFRKKFPIRRQKEGQLHACFFKGLFLFFPVLEQGHMNIRC